MNINILHILIPRQLGAILGLTMAIRYFANKNRASEWAPDLQ